MKKLILNLVLIVTIALVPLGANTTVVYANKSTSTFSSVIFPGSIQCGTLKGWGVWRSTADIYQTYRTVYFEPNRAGTHKIQFYLLGDSTKMTPSWSNDGGKKWTSWSWGDNGLVYDSNPLFRTYYKLDLRTDTTKTIYRFTFSPSGYHGIIWYRFYCA